MSGSALPVATEEIRCVRCGTVNRVGVYSLDKLPRCGKCQTGLPEPIARRVQRQLLTHWRLLVMATLAGGAIWWQPAFLTEFLAEREQSPATKATAEYCARYPRPMTGIQTVYDPTDRLAPLTIKTSAGGGYFVKLEKMISGTPAMTFFVRGGETIHTMVPEGSFVLKYATGDQWCGEVNLFGRNTVTQQADKTFLFDEDHSYTVELIARKDGNLRTKTIDRGRF